MPATSSPTRWVSRMYAAQQPAAASAKATPTGSAVPAHGWVSSSTPTAASSGQTRRRAAAAGHRHAERPEELQRAGRAERQPGHRRHEQQGDARGDHAEQHAGAQRRAGEVATAAAGPTTSSSTPAQASRSQAAPRRRPRRSGPTEAARPSCTQSIEAIAIEVPARADGVG